MKTNVGMGASGTRAIAGPLVACALAAGVLWGAPARAVSMPWGPDVSVNQACVKCDSRYADMKVHKSGNAVAIWVQNDGIEDIAVARFDAANGIWRGFKTLYRGIYKGDSAGVHAPHLAMDDDGNVTAVWTETASNTLYAARYAAATSTWTAPAAIHVGRDFWFADALAAADRHGNVIVEWTEGASEPRVMVKRYDAGNRTWSASIPLAAEPTLQGSAMAVDPDGNAMVLWHRNSDHGVVFSRYAAASRQWSAPALAGRAAAGSGVSLAFDRYGNATGLWSTGASGADPYGRVSAARYDARSNAWSAARMLQTTSGNVLSPDMATDAAGNVFVVWSQAPDYAHPLKATAVRYDARTGQWSRPQAISGGLQDDLWLKIATGRDGDATVVWSQTSRPIDGGDRYFHKASVRFDAAHGTWGRVQLGANEVVEAIAVGLGVDASGNALALYMQDSGYRWNGSIIYGVRANRLIARP